MKRFFYEILSMVLACAFAACQDSSSLSVGELKCEMLENPLAIDNTSPHFSWRMYGGQDGTVPVAYQILVATMPDKLTEADADLWNTGKVMDGNSVGILYKGKPLASRSLAYWKVRVWNQNDEASDWSTPALFGVGLLNEAEWADNACFIGAQHLEGCRFLSQELLRSLVFKDTAKISKAYHPKCPFPTKKQKLRTKCN